METSISSIASCILASQEKLDYSHCIENMTPKVSSAKGAVLELKACAPKLVLLSPDKGFLDALDIHTSAQALKNALRVKHTAIEP